jgi:tRNA/rRNA methyltransferase
VRIVLLRPRNPQNLGAAARAMKNFGLDDWVIVELGTHDFAAARRVAVNAEELLDRPRLVRTLDEAVADCAWVVGTSSRRVRGMRRLLPGAVAAEVLARAPGRTAIVFGDERSGLSNEDVARCHDLSTVPSSAEQPSLNVAQALVVYGYALAAAAQAAPPSPGAGSSPISASDGELQGVEAALRELLRDGGFLRGPERHALRDLAATLRRARLSRAEARLWNAALRCVGRRLPGGG